MRALFTCTPGLGHVLPLTPIAHAVAEAGHDVAFGTPSVLRPVIEAAGFRWIKLGVGSDDPELAAVRARQAEVSGPERSRIARENLFGGVLVRRLVPDLLALAETWRPDVIVRESWELGAMIAAELLGVPHAKVETDAAGALPFETADFYEPIRRLRATPGPTGPLDTRAAGRVPRACPLPCQVAHGRVSHCAYRPPRAHASRR